MSLRKTHWWQPIKGKDSEKSTIRNEGGDIYWCQRRRDTRSNKKETDEIQDTANERLYVKCQCLSDWCGYDIQRVRDLFRDSADYKRQRKNISLCNKRLVWRCDAKIKRLWRTQRDFILRNF